VLGGDVSRGEAVQRLAACALVGKQLVPSQANHTLPVAIAARTAVCAVIQVATA